MKSFPIILKGWRERRSIGKESKTAREIGQLLEMNCKEKGETEDFKETCKLVERGCVGKA